MSSEQNRDIVRGWVRRVLPWALLAAAAFLLLTELQRRSPVAAGAPAPDFHARQVDGAAFSLDDIEGGVVVLNFWATWCGPCRAEAPVLSRAHHRLSSAGGTVIGVTLDHGDLSEIESVARGWGMPFPIVRTDDETIATWRVTQLPTTYVLAPDGSIARAFVGAVDDEQLGEAIAGAVSSR